MLKLVKRIGNGVGWDQKFLCCSLDKTVNLWSALEYGNLEVVHTHSKELASSTHFLIWISRSVLSSQNSIESFEQGTWVNLARISNAFLWSGDLAGDSRATCLLVPSTTREFLRWSNRSVHGP